MGDFLKRLVTTVIFVATYLFIVRIVSIWVSLAIAHIPYTITSNNDLNLINIDNAQQLTHVVSVADLIFSVVLILTGSIVLAKTLLLNDLTRNPRILVKVIHYNLLGWLEDGRQMYPQLFGWGILLWVATIIVAKNAYLLAVPAYWAIALTLFTIYFTYRIFSFLDKHINDMISYIYAEKN